MLWAPMYLLLHHVVRLIIGSSNEEMSTEVVVLRHQLKRPGGKSPSSPPRPGVHGRDKQGSPSSSVVIVHGQPSNAPSLAPGAGAKEMDVRTEVGWREAPHQ